MILQSVRRWLLFAVSGAVTSVGFVGVGFAAVLSAPFASDYSITNLGSIANVTTNYGGLTLLAGTTDTLLIGGSANNNSGELFTVGLTRDIDGHITGFSSPASVYGSAPYNDGGLVYGPGGVLFASQWPVNLLSQYKPGSTSPDKVIDLGALGVAASHAAINFVPPGFSGAGLMKLVSWSGGQFYSASFAPDGNGTYDITGVTLEATLSGGPEGFAYVPLGSTGFTNPSMIVSEYSAGKVGIYDVDANGNPLVGTRRDFITGLSGAEGAFIDPITGDFLFSTFGSGNEVFVVRGFAAPPPDGTVPEPASILVFSGLGLCAIAISYTRRRRMS